MIHLKANTAITLRVGPFLDEDDGKTAETVLTIVQADIRLSKAGGDFAQTNDSSGATHDEAGWYFLQLNTTDTNTEGLLILAIHESGALPVWKEFMVLAEAAYDSLYAAKDTGYMDVNVKAISEDTTAADNLETACDGGSYNVGGGSIIASSVTGAVGSVTGHTVQTGDTYALANGAQGFAAIDTVVDAIKVKTDFLPSATAGAAGGVFIAGTNAATTITTSLTTTFTGNLTGSVGSVTGDTKQTADHTANIADILTDTAEIGAAGAGLTEAGGTGDQLTALGGFTAGAINAAAIANGAIDAATFAANAIDSTAVGLLTNANFTHVDANERVDVGEWLGTAVTSGTGGPDVNVNAIGDSTTAATNLSASALGIVSGACEGTPSTTVIQTDLSEATDDHYIGRVVVFTSGAAAGQASDITDYTGSSGTITVTALTTAPAATDTFVIV